VGKRTVVAIALVFLTAGFGIGPALADDKGNINYGQKGVADEAQANAKARDIVSNIRQITLFHGEDNTPCWGSYPWSPDGKEIVYMSRRLEENGTVADTDIYKMLADGTECELLTTHGGTHPTFTSDGKYIVFSRGAPSYACEDGEALDPSFNPAGGLDVWIMDADGSNPTPLTEEVIYGAPGKNKALPSPDGSRIVYHMQGGMYMFDIERVNDVWQAGDPRQVTDLLGPAHYIWGTELALDYLLFDAVVGGDHGDLVGDDVPSGSKAVGRRIYKTTGDLGSEFPDAVSLTDDDLNVYAPDGTVIATASWPTDQHTWSAKSNNWASPSPDGNWIAFHARYGRYEEGVYENKYEYSALRLMRINGTDKRTLVIKGGGEDGTGLDPDWVSVCGPTSWSPDSQLIAFKMRRPSNNGATTSVNSSSCDYDCDFACDCDCDYDYDGNCDGEGDGLSPSDEVSDEWGERPSIFVYNIRTGEIIQLTDGYDDFRMWWNPGDESQILFKDHPYAKCRDNDSYGKDLLTINITSWGVARLHGNILPIPTLSQWGLIGAALLLGGTGLFMMRRRKRHDRVS